jgi:hypothetical protein
VSHHPSITGILRYFSYEHLRPGPLKETSKKFSLLAAELVEELPAGPELTVALRKLLESKDAAVRSALDVK